MTPAGIEPATFRFIAQHLNHCATAVPQINGYGNENILCNYEQVYWSSHLYVLLRAWDPEHIDQKISNIIIIIIICKVLLVVWNGLRIRDWVAVTKILHKGVELTADWIRLNNEVLDTS